MGVLRKFKANIKVPKLNLQQAVFVLDKTRHFWVTNNSDLQASPKVGQFQSQMRSGDLGVLIVFRVMFLLTNILHEFFTWFLQQDVAIK